MRTLYKKKADKGLPVNSSSSDGSIPGGLSDWRERAIMREAERGVGAQRYKYDQWLRPRLATFERGQRLTQERLSVIIVGDILTSEEKDVLEEILFNREGALAWDFPEIGQVSAEVSPPQVIRTIPHEAWQAKAFNTPKALYDKVVSIVKDRVKKKVIEPCQGPYRNPFFLVAKKQ